MTQQTLNPFRFQTHESVYGTRPRHRRSRLAAQAIVVLLAITIPVLPVSPAFAQVLEVPQVISAPASPPSSSSYGSAPGRYGSAPEGSTSDRDAYGSPGEPGPNGSAPAGSAADPSAYNGWGPASSPDNNADPNAPVDPTSAPPTVASNSGYAPDPNLGSIDDYQNQQGGNAQSAPGVTFGGGQRVEPPQSMTTKLIVGGLIVGLVALGMATSHHHR